MRSRLRGGDICKISYVDIKEDGSIPDEYAEEPDNFDLENAYTEVDIALDSSHNDMAGHLEESYNHPLSLKDMSKEDKTNLREIFRQLRRLRFCVQNLKYKLCIVYKGYLCCIRRLIPATSKSPYILLGIKALLVASSWWIIRYFYLSRQK